MNYLKVLLGAAAGATIVLAFRDFEGADGCSPPSPARDGPRAT